jgi:acyl-coenzyme A synthetase/AMP-(fatty) acid ligase/thioesterase domain-containing protein/acyl carrier protein
MAQAAGRGASPSAFDDADAPWDRGPFLDTWHLSLPDAVHRVAELRGDAVVLMVGNESVTYTEFDSQANQIAHAALDRGLRDGTRVVLMLDHGVAAHTAFLGAVATGAAAAQLDDHEPIARLRGKYDAAQAALVITTHDHAEIAQELAGDRVLFVEDTAAFPTTPPGITVDPEAAVSVGFTSGTTGEPKMLMRTHEDVVRKAANFSYLYGIGPADRYGAAGSLSAGAVTAKMWDAACNGATASFYDLATFGPQGVPDWVNDHGVTMLWFVPSVARAVLDAASTAMPTVHTVLFGGEALYGRDARRLRALCAPNAKLYNRLNSSEGGHVTSYLVQPEDEAVDGPVPVGLPVPWTSVRIVDDEDNEVPQGESGALVVISSHMTKTGYANDRALTAEKYYTEPDGRRAYRSSDLARMRPDGVLEHLGRGDARVKIRGAMVAPGAVESALVELDGVGAAAVIAAPAEGGGMRLVAYVAPEDQRALSPWQLRRDLAQKLPTTMVPSAVVVLDSLPYGIRGKLDRHALPPPPSTASTPYVEPAGHEKELAEIFSEVLHVEKIGRNDDFFELGGDSLAVLELVAAIAERFGVDVVASTILDAPTVAQLAPRLTHRRDRHSSVVVPVSTIRSNGSAATTHRFFCATGGGAPAMSLRSLADAMHHTEVYGIQPRGLEERAWPDHSVEAAARRYLDGIRAVQPSGPYLVGGYSFGGVVAFELACQLQRAGERVDLLVILDTGAPGARPTRGDRLRWRADALRTDAPPSGVKRRATVAARSATFAIQSAYAHAERRYSLTTAGLFPRKGLEQYELFLRLNGRMSREYEPTSTFLGRVLVLRTGSPDGDSSQGRNRTDELGWSRVASGPITVEEVPGDHLGMIRRPHVTTLATVLEGALDAAS